MMKQFFIIANIYRYPLKWLVKHVEFINQVALLCS